MLVLRGERGVGKSTLLDFVRREAAGFRIESAAGAKSEMAIPFAGLHQLCSPWLHLLERLPRPQREALATVFGLDGGDRPDGFLVRLATLGLLTEACANGPLLWLVDDAHWLDAETVDVLAFASRRLETQLFAMVLAVCEPTEALAGLPELVVQQLRREDARALLATLVVSPLEDRVRDQIVAETHGNPRALWELAQALPAKGLAGGFGYPTGLLLPPELEAQLARRITSLPDDTRQLLLLAAAEPGGDAALMWRASARLAIAVDAAAAAETEGMLAFGRRVVFCDPLTRAAVYRLASSTERTRVHGALAAAIDPEVDPAWCAWHSAQAATAPDPPLADALERLARQTDPCGGFGGAAAFLEQAAILSSDRTLRAERLLAAAEAKLVAGAPEAALTLLGRVEADRLADAQRALADRVKVMASASISPADDVARALRELGLRLASTDPAAAREAYRDALAAALAGGRVGSGLVELAEAICATNAPQRPSETDLLLDGVARTILEGPRAGFRCSATRWPRCEAAVCAAGVTSGGSRSRVRRRSFPGTRVPGS